MTTTNGTQKMVKVRLLNDGGYDNAKCDFPIVVSGVINSFGNASITSKELEKSAFNKGTFSADWPGYSFLIGTECEIIDE